MLASRFVVGKLKAVFPILLLLAAEGVAMADPVPREAAREHYQRGVDLATQGAYQAALQEFRKAYETSPHFAVLYNIGQAQVALGRPIEAIDTLTRYLHDGQSQVPPSRRQEVEAQIALLESRLAELTVTTDRPGVLIRVDEVEMGETPLLQPIRLGAGTHEVSATLDGAPVVVRSVKLGEAERRTLDLAPVPAPAAAAAPRGTLFVRCDRPEVQAYVDGKPIDLESAQHGIPVAPGDHRVGFAGPGQTWTEQGAMVTATDPALVACGEGAPAPAAAPVQEAVLREQLDGSQSSPTLAYVLGGAGVAVGGGGLAHYLWNRGRYADWRATNADLAGERGEPGYRERQIDNNRLADSIDRASRVTVGLTVASGALIAGGAFLLFTHGGSGSEDDSGSGLVLLWNGGASGEVGFRGRF